MHRASYVRSARDTNGSIEPQMIDVMSGLRTHMREIARQRAEAEGSAGRRGESQA